MFKTRLTEMLGIEYPIIQGGMVNIGRAELAAAVSNAGGLGILSSVTLDSPDHLREEIRRTKSLTSKPFGVNINLFPAQRPPPNEAFIEVLIEEGVRVVETSGHRSPEEYMPTLKKGNVKVMHKVASVRHALTAERIGADAVIVVGYENGGATGVSDTTTMVLVPLAVDAVKIPVVSGGGIGDARG
ncbi:MAG: nitronate monooxygenase, partial [Chloroflexi bacterium]|nr:nitronate monooxygenase [Chloroflexota bacterium]